jgi:hypothetical protein
VRLKADGKVSAKKLTRKSFMKSTSNLYEIPIPQPFLPSRFYMASCPSYPCGPHVRTAVT